jgi:hypothetical protein
MPQLITVLMLFHAMLPWVIIAPFGKPSCRRCNKFPGSSIFKSGQSLNVAAQDSRSAKALSVAARSESQ